MEAEEAQIKKWIERNRPVAWIKEKFKAVYPTVSIIYQDRRTHVFKTTFQVHNKGQFTYDFADFKGAFAHIYNEFRGLIEFRVAKEAAPEERKLFIALGTLQALEALEK